MLRKGVVSIWILCCWAGNAFGQNRNAFSEKYYQLIEAPTAPDKWDAWRSELRAWKDSTLKSLNYKGENSNWWGANQCITLTEPIKFNCPILTDKRHSNTY
ncbi:hypothetical protein GO730_01720 [Spirosoma sp. HMF3257]|uniref:Uncharacterized protein n=1 Tax=Spirosoma telluris TaxID=2183553 RepID=A0A327NDT9_9BACT|nr:hypothetical protein [Spirosoma telluris]RAI73461.1 hypothetical protein HMF3257_01690 [Spirosoma telluris]